jgi:hypothetical protein
MVRLIVPAVIIILFSAIFGIVTGLWKPLTLDFSKAAYMPSIMIPAVLYYITPLRSWLNKPHHNRITEHIRSELVRISGTDDQPNRFTWRSLRPLFFSLIDSDDSLKRKSEIAYFNGAVWTTCADTTALGLLFSLLSIGAWGVFNIENTLVAGVIFLGISTLGRLGSLATTRKQIDIASEQIDLIELKYKNNVERRIIELER